MVHFDISVYSRVPAEQGHRVDAAHPHPRFNHWLVAWVRVERVAVGASFCELPNI